MVKYLCYDLEACFLKKGCKRGDTKILEIAFTSGVKSYQRLVNPLTKYQNGKEVINSLNSYPHTFTGTQNTEYTVESASGTSWETSITINQGNKVHAIISLMVGKQGDANTYYDLYFNVDGGSYAKTAQGDASGSRSRHLAKC